ncbi:hypothetical protein [uncultured Campylobacter sp.]|uniref:hypothetical protein n=1 Tax=uncultured Campylobacter sp. TaxID=218934 RepID=UPI0026111FD5|nr:hypothetical protein [uncultured Campylobacter sp.]
MTRPKITSPILAIFALKFVKEREQQLKLKFAFKFKSFVPAQERKQTKSQGRESRKDVLSIALYGRHFHKFKSAKRRKPYSNSIFFR